MHSLDIFYLAAGVEGFWEGLATCRDVAETTPVDRWDADFNYSQQGAKSGTYARFGAYCAEVAAFDATCFRLPASEALALDPHTRLLLTLAQVWFLSRVCRVLGLKIGGSLNPKPRLRSGAT